MTGLAPLRQPAFRRLFLGRTITYLGNAIAPIALGFAVLDLTGSVAALGIVVGVRSIGNVALLLVGGVLADRVPRTVLLSGSELVAAATQAAVATLVLTGMATVPLLAALGLLNGAAAALAMPAASALLPQTVPAELLRQANALGRMGVTGASIGGAAAGGALVAAVGPGWGLAADAASFLVAGLLFRRIRVPELQRADRPSPLRDLVDGWTEFRSRQWVWVIVLQFMVVNAAYAGGVFVLGPAVADATFGRAGWGVALALQAAGLFAGGLIALRWQPRRALLAGVALTMVTAAPLAALATVPSLLVLGPALFLTGMALEQFAVAWDVALQENVPAERLARVYSYDALGSFIAIPVGEVSVGPIAEQAGLAPTLTACAVAVVAATGLALLSPQVRQLRRRAPAPQPLSS